MHAAHPHDQVVASWSDADQREFEKQLLRLSAASSIQEILDDLSIAQADVAKRIGKSRAWVSKALSGGQNLTLDSLADLAWAVGARCSHEVVSVREPATQWSNLTAPEDESGDDLVSIFEFSLNDAFGQSAQRETGANVAFATTDQPETM